MNIDEWLKTQPKEVQEEFDRMESKQKEITNREMPVSQIYYGNKPIASTNIEKLKYFPNSLTPIQANVFKMYFEQGMTQEEIGSRLGTSRVNITLHIKAIKHKAENLILT